MSAGGDLPGAVLFACSRNAVRSPMAAAILKHLARNRIYVESAGVRPGAPDPFAPWQAHAPAITIMAVIPAVYFIVDLRRYIVGALDAPEGTGARAAGVAPRALGGTLHRRGSSDFEPGAAIPWGPRRGNAGSWRHPRRR